MSSLPRTDSVPGRLKPRKSWASQGDVVALAKSSGFCLDSCQECRSAS